MFNDGGVYLSLHGSVTMSVNMVLADYPYDVQNITITVVSWAHTASEIFIYPSGENVKDSIS